MNAHIDFPQRAGEARLNITFDGKNGDLAQAVPFGASDAQLKAWAREAILGGVLGDVTGPVSLADHVVDRFEATDRAPVNRIFLRPATPFG
jgi:hypothetical protein